MYGGELGETAGLEDLSDRLSFFVAEAALSTQRHLGFAEVRQAGATVEAEAAVVYQG